MTTDRIKASAEDLAGIAAQLGATAEVVEARPGIAILYYAGAKPSGSLERNWDELHVRLDRPAKIVVAVFPETSS